MGRRRTSHPSNDARRCARCKKKFSGDTGFITCPECRIYLPNHDQPDGCHYWEGAAADTRVTKQGDSILDYKEIMRKHSK